MIDLNTVLQQQLAHFSVTMLHPLTSDPTPVTHCLRSHRSGKSKRRSSARPHSVGLRAGFQQQLAHIDMASTSRCSQRSHHSAGSRMIDRRAEPQQKETHRSVSMLCRHHERCRTRDCFCIDTSTAKLEQHSACVDVAELGGNEQRSGTRVLGIVGRCAGR
jgi:hypothetical protein